GRRRPLQPRMVDDGGGDRRGGGRRPARRRSHPRRRVSIRRSGGRRCVGAARGCSVAMYGPTTDDRRPTTRQRIVVAMSGGVDSSLAAALLVEQGYDVVGVSMRLWEGGESGCCSLDDFLDARRVADQLGIPFYVMDFRAAFGSAVIDQFVAE